MHFYVCSLIYFVSILSCVHTCENLVQHTCALRRAALILARRASMDKLRDAAQRPNTGPIHRPAVSPSK